ncbi:hypothetical protein E4U16_004774 [Claviceps sp. LM84 group G4]|nr:hypothetical protein E4U16_004774 [Claviceps sp. LM84 group G4]
MFGALRPLTSFSSGMPSNRSQYLHLKRPQLVGVINFRNVDRECDKMFHYGALETMFLGQKWWLSDEARASILECPDRSTTMPVT